MTTTGSPSKATDRERCIFCKVVDGKEKNEILYSDQDVVVFYDIKPAAKYHLLVAPRKHIKDCKSIDSEDIGLFDKLLEIGDEVISSKINQDESFTKPQDIPILRGFHWPPFHAISHLHLHVIAPSNQMNFLSKVIFRPNSYWFVTPEYVKQHIQNRQHHKS